MKMRLLTAVLAAAGLAHTAHAHDFWLETDASMQGEERCVTLHTQIGHGSDRQAWPMVPTRLLSLGRHDASGSTGLLHVVGEDGLDGEVTSCGIGSGTQLYVIQGFRAFSTLEAERFNDYIAEEGIRPLMAHRVSNGLMEEEGRELYSRIGKSVLPGDDDGAFVTRPLGLLLEITPLIAPSQLAAGDTLQVEVGYRGAPAAGAMIHVSALDDETLEAGPLTTDAEGRASLEIPAAGQWMLHVVWGEAADGLMMDADYATVFSSLTFEVAGD